MAEQGTTGAKVGRPTDYNQELVDEICIRIAEGNSLRRVCDSDDAMPEWRTVFRWLNKYEEFSQQYTRAKEKQAEAYEDMMLDTARSEADVNRARLIIDTMKWTASKLKPKKYGDRVDLTTNGKDLPTPLFGGISTSNITDDIKPAE